MFTTPTISGHIAVQLCDSLTHADQCAHTCLVISYTSVGGKNTSCFDYQAFSVVYRKHRFWPMRTSWALTWFPVESIPWKATFVASEGLLGTDMVSSRVDSVEETFVVNEDLLGTYMVSSLVIPWKATFVANEGLLGTDMVSRIPWKKRLWSMRASSMYTIPCLSRNC